MSDVLFLAWRYLRFHWIKSGVMVGSISLVLFLPLGLQVVVRQGADRLTSRASATPLLVGARGSAVDLALSALYFREPTVDPIAFREVTRVNESGLATGIPLHVRFTVGRHRIVGTTIEYMAFRGLRLAKGRAVALLGECVLGARAAQVLEAEVGGHVLSTPAGAFDVAGSYPLKMPVVGILETTGSPDDDIVLTDLKTAWVIAGVAHGHGDVAAPEAEDSVLRREGNNVVASPAVLSYTEITPDNIGSFHFHGDPTTFPVDAVIAVPADRRSGVVLRGRYETAGEGVQMVVPLRVIRGLLDTVFSVRDAIVLGSAFVLLATAAIATLVFALSIRLRHQEIETIRKIGGPRRRVRAILLAEILMVVGGAALLSGAMTLAVARLDDVLLRVIAG